MEGNIVTDLVVPILLAVTMAGMGMSLVAADFRRVFVQPRAVAVGLAGQLLALPALGFGFAWLLRVPPEIGAGVAVIVACPGGVTSNLLAHVARADTALSVTLTTVSSFLGAITIPIVVNLGLQVFMGHDSVEIPIVESALKVFAITVPPVLAGMWIRARWPGFATRADPFVRAGALTLLVGLLIAVAIAERDQLGSLLAAAGPVSALLCGTAMLVGFTAARSVGLGRKQVLSITIEVGFQNGALAIVIATGILHSPAIAVVPAVYTLVMYLPAGALALYGARTGAPTRTARA